MKDNNTLADDLYERNAVLEKALIALRDFEPVTNGDYAVVIAIPAMRRIAIEALQSAPQRGIDLTEGKS